MKNIAVLLAAFNGSDYIVPQIRSILNQIDVSVDIFIRDDASNNLTFDKISNELADERLHYLNENTSTGSPAGNFFLLLSQIDIEKYDYISFSDQDDVWFPEKLISAITYLLNNHADAYSSDLIAFDNTKFRAWHLKKFSQQKKFDYLFQGASAGCTYVITRHCAKLILSVLGEQAKSFPKGHSHDWLIYAICRSHGINWVHDDRAFIAYRQHSSNEFGAMPGASGLFSRLRLARSGWYRKQILSNKFFLSQNIDELKILNAISRFNLSDRFFLIRLIFNFRRSNRDCIFLFIVILFGFF